jgi:hypothetical protein
VNLFCSASLISQSVANYLAQGYWQTTLHKYWISMYVSVLQPSTNNEHE